MQLQQLNVLRRAADHRLDEQRRALREQAATVAALEAALATLDADVARERAEGSSGEHRLLSMPGWLDNQRARRELLVGELEDARGLLDQRIDQAREIYLELRSVDHVIDRQRDAEAREARRRADAFMDFVGERSWRARLPVRD